MNYLEGVDCRWMETRPSNSTASRLWVKNKLSDRKIGEDKRMTVKKKKGRE
jgi:hypothetical protein